MSFPPSRTTNLRNEISNFQQRFDDSFHEAWDRYKDLLRTCPHHGFTELHQVNTFYNALNPTDQDSLNSGAGGNLLESRTQDVLTSIENKSKVRNSQSKWIVSQVKSSDANSTSSSKIAKLTHAVNQQTSAVTTAMTAILRQFQATPPPASVKFVEEICVTCGGAHPYYQCLAADCNTFPELQDNIQGYVAAAAVNYDQGNFGYRPSGMNTASTLGSGPLPSNTIANPKGELKAITTRGGIVLDGPCVLIPPPFINPKEGERVEETLTDHDLADELKCKALANLGASINLMPLSVWKKLGFHELISTRMTLELANRAFCTPTGIARDVFVSVGKFIFSANFVIVDYESDPRVPLILGRPFLRTARTLIDVHGEEMIIRNGDERLTLNMRHDTSSYSNQPKKESINMINIFNDSCEDFFEDLFATNHQSGNPTFSSHPDLTSPEVKDDIFDPEGCNVLIEKFIDLDSTKDLPPPHNINPLSGNNTSFSPNHLLEEFTDELPLITFPPGNDDLPFDIESNLKEIEYLLNHDPIKEMDSILEDLIDENNLADLDDNLVDTMPEMFTDEHALDYSSPPLYDEYYHDPFEDESDTEYVYDDPSDSKGEKIKESKLLIDELDVPRSSAFLLSPEYDSYLFKDFSEVDALPSTNNEDKVFNPWILIQENPFEVIAHDNNVKKLAISHASLILEDFDPPLSLYELPFYKEVPRSETLLSFSFENEEKISSPGFSLLKEFILLFSQNYFAGALNLSNSLKFLKSQWRFFLALLERDLHLGCFVSPLLSLMNESIRGLGMDECLALADLEASINLMPLSVWNKVSLPGLSLTYMTLELADRLISRSVRVAEDVFVKVGTFHFPTDFVVIDFDADPRVPLILKRSFLKTRRDLIDVFEGELTLRVGKEAITFNLDQTLRYLANYNDMTARRINVIDMACEEYSQEVLGFSDVIASGNPTPYYDSIVSTSSPTLTPFGDSDFLLEEVDAFLALEDDPTLPLVDHSYIDTEGDILILEAFLNDDPSLPPPN
uniref:Reverse transcriptase domain-containing protein n=1 Tax=Tanacetum cinerariifolium TaxID=118510 RepID=A0A6L2KNZ0_TANCI|nr:reverse transcriptase domain-containing protein [Tanacetum cinerariifolium]